MLWLLACTQGHEGEYELGLAVTVSDCSTPPEPRELLSLAVRAAGTSGWQVAPADEACTGREDGFDCEVAAFDTTGDYADAGVDAIVSIDLDLAGPGLARRGSPPRSPTRSRAPARIAPGW